MIEPLVVVLEETFAFLNPAKGRDPTIRTVLGDVEALEITIFDVSGNVVHSRSFPGVPVGRTGESTFYEYTWTGPKASGVYYMVIHGKRSGDVKRARVKFVVIR